MIVSLSYAAFIVLRLMSHDLDPSFFITAGDRFVDRNAVPGNIRVIENSYGYDGQFYYRFGLDPFTSKKTEFGITIDKPSYRHQRIFYPMTAWLFSLGGNPSLLPSVMVLINYLSLCLLSWLAAEYFQSLNENVLWSLVIPLYPGFILSLSRDLTEIMGVLFIMAGLLAYRKNRYLTFNLIMTLAILTRETALLAAAAVAICLPGVWKKQRMRLPTVLSFLIPFSVYVIWQIILFLLWGDLPLSSGNMNVGTPFLGFAGFLKYSLKLETHLQRVWSAELVFIILFTVSVAAVFFRSVAPLHIKISWLFYAVLCFSLSNYIWLEDWAFMRVLSEFFLFGSLILMVSKNRARVPIFIYSVAVWLYLFRTHAFY